MGETGAYGRKLAGAFGLASAPSFVTRSLRKSAFAVTEIDCHIANNGMTAPIAREDALLVTLQLIDCPRHDLWIDGKPRRTGYLAAGTTCIYDLRSSPVVNSISAFHNLHFYFPRQALNAIAEHDGMPVIQEVNHDPGTGIADDVLKGLGWSLLPAFERVEEANTLFVDHITIAAAAYLARALGNGRSPRPLPACTLTTWQESRAKELIDSHLDGEVPLAALATECGLSVRQFCHAFQRTLGRSPHQWLLQRRIEKATDRLRTTTLPVDQIAAACGFSSVRHLRRSFDRVVGASPEQCRASNAAEQSRRP